MNELDFENILPDQIEKRSFEIITQELGNIKLADENADVIKRVIHTTADFEYVSSLCFSENAVKHAREAILGGASIVTDTKMASVGINAIRLSQYGGQVFSFMSDEDVAADAKENGTTRAAACMKKAVSIDKPLIIAVGNAPTALIKLEELIREKRIKPELIIGVPVGFVNVVQSKELIMGAGIPYIVAKGRKGGSNVAAAICNALIYGIDGK
ncbi:precorrin-8X methylmutase [Anaerotalea alkaliphila]|uniref:Precorrin-8X methylmutase n=1 Tax=Anaerotalea alkaliphila TaxID=2662126 RepID=A0A7X5HX96_9FIRM|nr:precorrin-8X methylmutase [Anaerotalea alkaliphila]NDL68345.1 precorrin-8X methylmutase [Anaerotalea alkaliphila]